MLYDTHCHPNLAKNKDTKQIIEDFLEENPEGFLNVIWTNPETNSDILELASKYEKVYCSVWIHPCDIADLDLEESILGLEDNVLKNKEKIVAIWECGLDYYHDKDKKKEQKEFFKMQIKLAKKYNLPIIIHNRGSKDDILEILKEKDFKNFIFHCYSEDLEYAKKLIKFSPECKLSFSWIVTFKNALDIQETARNIPLVNILVETDSPYLTPTPFRWKQENEPSFTKYVLEKIIELRNETPLEIKKQIFKNSTNVFWI